MSYSLFELSFVRFRSMVCTLALITILMIFSSRIKLTEDFNAFWMIYLIVINKFTMIEGYLWKHFIHFLLAINVIHILCRDFVFFFFISDDPYASSRKKSNLLYYFTEWQIIYKNNSLDLFLLWFLCILTLIIIFNCSRLIITKNIISI